MTLYRPKGGFAVTEIAHLGVGARCCYNSVEFAIREEASEGERYNLYVFGKLKGDDCHIYNGTEISMSKEQLIKLAEYIMKEMGVRNDD